MKCVLLAAGKGVRMLPLTKDTPKPLLDIEGVTLLERILSIFPEEVNEFIVVIGYKGDQIKDKVGENLLGRPVRYVNQENPQGTYDALLRAKEFLNPQERFFLVNGDDMHSPEAVKRMLSFERAVAVFKAEDPRSYGVVEVDSNNKVLKIEEKPDNPKSNLVSTGLFLLDDKVFNFPPPIVNGEYYVSTAISNMLSNYEMYAVETPFWFPITTPVHLEEYRTLLRKSK